MLPQNAFWFLRHGETDYNARGLSQGAIDVPLNDSGRAQARGAGPLLQDRGITRIISSPMLRTRETTAIVNQTLALPVHYEPDLREVVFGGMEGKPLLPWFPDWLEGSYTPAGAESFVTLLQRVKMTMQRILQTPGPVLVVAHGGVFGAIRDSMALPRASLVSNGMPLLCEPGESGWSVRAA